MFVSIRRLKMKQSRPVLLLTTGEHPLRLRAKGSQPTYPLYKDPRWIGQLCSSVIWAGSTSRTWGVGVGAAMMSGLSGLSVMASSINDSPEIQMAKEKNLVCLSNSSLCWLIFIAEGDRLGREEWGNCSASQEPRGGWRHSWRSTSTEPGSCWLRVHVKKSWIRGHIWRKVPQYSFPSVLAFNIVRGKKTAFSFVTDESCQGFTKTIVLKYILWKAIKNLHNFMLKNWPPTPGACSWRSNRSVNHLVGRLIGPL